MQSHLSSSSTLPGSRRGYLRRQVRKFWLKRWPTSYSTYSCSHSCGCECSRLWPPAVSPADVSASRDAGVGGEDKVGGGSGGKHITSMALRLAAYADCSSICRYANSSSTQVLQYPPRTIITESLGINKTSLRFIAIAFNAMRS